MTPLNGRVTMFKPMSMHEPSEGESTMFLRTLSTALIGLSLIATAQAAVYTNAGISGSFNDIASWVGGVVPVEADTAVYDATGDYQIDIATSVTNSYIYFQAPGPGTLTLNVATNERYRMPSAGAVDRVIVSRAAGQTNRVVLKGGGLLGRGFQNEIRMRVGYPGLALFTVEGPDTAIDVRTLSIGYEGGSANNIMVFTNGARYTGINGEIAVGRGNFSSGNLLHITGSNTLVDIQYLNGNGTLQIGHSGGQANSDNRVIVDQGAMLRNAPGNGNIGRYIEIGTAGASQNAMLLLSDPGTSLSGNYVRVAATLGTSGNSGSSAYFVITNQASAEIEALIMGMNQGAAGRTPWGGHAVVDNATLDIKDFVQFGYVGTFTESGSGANNMSMRIHNGATVSVFNKFTMGALTNAMNHQVLVDGGSALDIGQVLTIGMTGHSNVLSVAGSSVVNAHGGVVLGQEPSSSNNWLSVDGGTLNVTNPYVPVNAVDVRRGTLQLANGGRIQADYVAVSNGATLVGAGTIDGGLQVCGTLMPGGQAQAGTLSVTNGTALMSGSAQLVVDVLGSAPGEVDLFILSDMAVVGGVLDVLLGPGYRPATTDAFEIVTAAAIAGGFTNAYPDGGVTKIAAGNGTFQLSTQDVSGVKVLVLDNYDAPPVVTVTNPVGVVTNVYIFDSYTVQGLANDEVIGSMAWTNTRTGGNGIFDAASAWSVAIPLGVGTNVVTVSGTNIAHQADAGTATIVREPEGVISPSVVITNVPGGTVSMDNDVTSFTLQGTNNFGVTGTMGWTNSLGGEDTFPAAWAWSVEITGLSQGTNVITVAGTNAAGEVATDSASLIVLPAGDGWPAITITNETPYSVASNVTSTGVGGSNNINVVGTMAWTNALNGSNGTLAATAFWVIDCPLDLGYNEITVSGSNALGQAASDAVTVLRGDAPPQTYHFSGATDDDYTVPGNWFEGFVPGANDTAVFYTNHTGSLDYSVNMDGANGATQTARNVFLNVNQTSGGVGFYPWNGSWHVTERMVIGEMPSITAKVQLQAFSNAGKQNTLFVTNDAGTAELVVGEASPGTLEFRNKDNQVIVDRLTVTNGTLSLLSPDSSKTSLVVRSGMTVKAGGAGDGTFDLKNARVVHLGGASEIDRFNASGTGTFDFVAGDLTVRAADFRGFPLHVGDGAQDAALTLSGGPDSPYLFSKGLVFNSPGATSVVEVGNLSVTNGTYDATLYVDKGRLHLRPVHEVLDSVYTNQTVLTNTNNRLANPGFEDGTDGDADFWSKWGNAARESWAARSGSYGATVRDWNGDESSGGWYQQVTNDAPIGETWTAGAWLWSDTGLAVYTAATMGVRIKFLDASFNELDTVIATCAAPGETWTPCTVSATSAPATAWVKVDLFADGQATNGALRFDDTTLVAPVVYTNYTVNTNYTVRGETWADRLAMTNPGAGLLFESGRLNLRGAQIDNGEPLAVGRTNLLSNPSFETPGGDAPAYWSTWGNTERVNWRSHRGGYEVSIRNWADDASGGGWWQQVDDGFAEGEVFQASVWVWNDASYANTSSKLIVRFNDGGSDFGGNTNVFTLPGERWTQVSVTATNPAGAAFVKFQVEVDGQGTSGALQLDDALLMAGNAYGPAELRLIGGQHALNDGLLIPGDGLLSGSGSIQGEVTLFGTVSPGASVGRLTAGADQTWNEGANYRWEIEDADGTPGNEYDTVQVTGTLTIANAMANPMQIDIVGNPANFDSTQPYTWTLAFSTNLVVSDGFAFTLRTDDFVPSLDNGAFRVRYDSANLYLYFIPAPTPPATVEASDGTYTGEVLVSWSGVTGADGYEVWRSEDPAVPAWLVNVTDTQYQDTAVGNGVIYWYWIKTTNAIGIGWLSASNSGYRYASSIPTGWWDEYGLSYTNTPDGDNDGDTHDNYNEYVADTDPTSSASFYENETTNIAGTATLVITIGPPTSPNRVYDVLGSTNLLDEDWAVIVGPLPGAADRGALNVEVTNEPAARVYRTGVRVP